MAFAVFRRHQKKLIAIFAIMAMFVFVLADSMQRMLQPSGYSSVDSVVVDLYGKPVKQSELNRMAQEKARVTRFLAAVLNRPAEEVQQFFGGLSTRDLVDSLILEHEADQLGLPSDPDVAKQWLTRTFKDRVDGRLLQQVFNSQFRNEVTDQQLLTELANQLRLREIRMLGMTPLVTPLDIFQSYRDQNERVSANAVPFSVEESVKDVPEPKDAELQAFYDRHKNREPDTANGIPGFTIPRRARAEFVGIDGASLGVQVSEDEVAARYEKEKASGQHALPALKSLPEDVFTPDEGPDAVHTARADWDPGEPAKRFRPLDEVRALIEADIRREKAVIAADDKLAPIRKAMNAFANERDTALAEQAEAQGKTVELPKPPDLKALAARDGLRYDSTPPITQAKADTFGDIAKAQIGLGQSGRETRFAEWLFLEQTELYEPAELNDSSDERFYVAWKTQNLAPEVPALKDIRDEVVTAWKLEQARPLALKAAQELADKAKGMNGDLRLAAGDRTVLTTSPVSRLQPGMQFAQFNVNIPPRPNDIAPLQDVGDEIRAAVFDPNDSDVRVAPNQSKSIIYVLAPVNRTPANFEGLYQPFGELPRLSQDARNDAFREAAFDWMRYLRGKALLDPAWLPEDERNLRRRGTAS